MQAVLFTDTPLQTKTCDATVSGLLCILVMPVPLGINLGAACPQHCHITVYACTSTNSHILSSLPGIGPQTLHCLLPQSAHIAVASSLQYVPIISCLKEFLSKSVHTCTYVNLSSKFACLQLCAHFMVAFYAFTEGCKIES